MKRLSIDHHPSFNFIHITNKANWSYSEIPNTLLLIVANNVLISKVASNCATFKKAFEDRPNEFHGICGSKDIAIANCYKIVTN